jgi:hypothetical protein
LPPQQPGSTLPLTLPQCTEPHRRAGDRVGPRTESAARENAGDRRPADVDPMFLVRFFIRICSYRGVSTELVCNCISIYLNTYLQCSMFAALEEAMGTSSTQAVRMHDEITVCRLHSQCTILTRSETGRPPTRCARHLTEGWRPGLRKSASGLLDGRSAWFGTDTRAPIAPTPMRVQHFGEKSTLARS